MVIGPVAESLIWVKLKFKYLIEEGNNSLEWVLIFLSFLKS